MKSLTETLFKPPLHLLLAVITELDLLDDIRWIVELICIHKLKLDSWRECAVLINPSLGVEYKWK